MASPFVLPALIGTLAATLILSPLLHAGETPVPAEQSSSRLADWWEGKTLTGDWFGVRNTLADELGLTFYGKYYGAFFGVVTSERGARGFWDQGIEFGAEQNFGRLLDNEVFKGVKGFGIFRYRDSQSSSNPNDFVLASSMFNPTNWYSGTQFRVLAFGLEIGTSTHLPVENMIVLRGGWLAPQREFIDQPLSKLFLNNAVNSAKGVGGNIPFSSSFSTWGGTLKVNPLKWYYAKGGVFMSFPSATDSGNHGLAYEGFARDPSQNGLFFMAETGITPKIGPAALEGRYAVGGYYWGQTRKSFDGTAGYGQYGMYLQADQQLFREEAPESPAPLAKGPSDGKSFKQPVAGEGPKFTNQGLSMFNLVTLAPKYNNPYPFYFQSGLVYTGLIPGRDADQTMFSIAYGSYSAQQIDSLQSAGVANQPNATIFLEGGYRFAINRWAFVQPFAQYAIQPSGTAAVANALILGFSTGLTF